MKKITILLTLLLSLTVICVNAQSIIHTSEIVQELNRLDSLRSIVIKEEIKLSHLMADIVIEKFEKGELMVPPFEIDVSTIANNKHLTELREEFFRMLKIERSQSVIFFARRDSIIKFQMKNADSLSIERFKANYFTNPEERKTVEKYNTARRCYFVESIKTYVGLCKEKNDYIKVSEITYDHQTLDENPEVKAQIKKIHLLKTIIDKKESELLKKV